MEAKRLNACYRDYIGQEQAAMENEESGRFWEEMLADHSVTPVPFAEGKSREGRSASMGHSRIELEESVEQGLRELAARSGASLKTVLLAAHMKALSLLTGSVDVTTGVVMNGRLEEETEIVYLDYF